MTASRSPPRLLSISTLSVPHRAPSVPHLRRRQDEAQHYSHSYGHGTQPGAVRVRGSVCHETDDERGRRVRYGAHAMLARA